MVKFNYDASHLISAFSIDAKLRRLQQSAPVGFYKQESYTPAETIEVALVPLTARELELLKSMLSTYKESLRAFTRDTTIKQGDIITVDKQDYKVVDLINYMKSRGNYLELVIACK